MGHKSLLVGWVGFLCAIGQVHSQACFVNEQPDGGALKGGNCVAYTVCASLGADGYTSGADIFGDCRNVANAVCCYQPSTGTGGGGSTGTQPLTCGVAQASLIGCSTSSSGAGSSISSGSPLGNTAGNGNSFGSSGSGDGAPSNRSARILGGTPVTDTQSRHCWIAEIRVTGNNGQTSQLRAAGAIVNEYSIITTASSIQGLNPGQLRVRIGTTSASTDAGSEFAVSTIMRHPGFRITKPLNYPVGDLAVLQLSTAIDFFSEIAVCGACLPDATMTTSVAGVAPQEPFLGDRCHVAGYGATALGGQTDGQLRQVMVPIIPTAVCDRIYRVALNRPTYTTDVSSICAGGQPGKDTCVTDGGAPLACISPDRYFYVVAGLSSFGIGCGQPGIPSVYTNLANSGPGSLTTRDSPIRHRHIARSVQPLRSGLN